MIKSIFGKYFVILLEKRFIDLLKKKYINIDRLKEYYLNF